MQLVNETIKNPSGWDSSSNYMGQTALISDIVSGAWTICHGSK